METPDSNRPIESSVENKEGLKLRILVAEDKPTMQRLTSRQLTNLGHTVVIVGNGQLLLDELATKTYDLIITDNNMPVMSGLEALEEIRKLYGNVPVIVYTSDTTKETVEKIEKTLGAVHLEKPPSGDMLKNAIKTAMKNK